MKRLQDRIGELYLETVVERGNLKGLHKDRIRIKKDKQARQADILAWEIKCNNIQMLKFGRLIDVDALEDGSDRSKEIEAEKTVKVVEDDSRLSLYKLQLEYDELKEKLAQVHMITIYLYLFCV
jgi:cilia- and flagella-associated protein 44